MERRLNITTKIEYALAHIASRVHVSKNLTDVNVIAEDTLKELFNLVYGYSLKNENYKKQNASTIDLYFDAEKIAYQITSQNKTTKIKKTVESFIKTKKYEYISKLVIFSITTEKKCSSDALDALEDYDVKGEYINISDFKDEIFRLKDDDDLETIAEFLEAEVSPKTTRKEVKATTKVSDRLKSLHIVEQIYEVLKMFEGFQSIYPRTIAKLYPFKVNKNSRTSYSRSCLKTDNLQIHEFLQKIEVKNGEISINDESLKGYKEKIVEIFTILNFSQIVCICYREKYTEIKHHSIKLLSFDPECSCMTCRFNRFNIKSLFSELKGKSVQHSEAGVDAIGEAYYLFKLGEPVKAWQLFNSIIRENKQDNEEVVRFLALYNTTKIRNFIDSPWWENEKKQILPKIDEIDLYESLSNLNVSIEVRNELIKVKENYFLNYAREEINYFYSQVLKSKKLYSSGGTSSGESSAQGLRNELIILYYFYVSNHIVIDYSSSFKRVISKGIEGLLISFSTEERYEYRYKSFDNSILSLMIFYIGYEDLERMFEDHEINNIPIIESEKSGFLNVVKNFFNFQYTKVFRSVNFNEDILRQDYFSHYRQSISYFFNNIMLILSKVDLKDDELKVITEPLINFLRAAEDLLPINWKYATIFLSKRIRVFSVDQIATLISQTVNGKSHRAGEDVIGNICRAASIKADFTLSEYSFDSLTKSVMAPCKNCGIVHNENLIIELWKIADENGKHFIREKTKKNLKKEFDADLYSSSVYKGIFTKESEPDLLRKYIDYIIKCCKPSDIQYIESRWVFSNFRGLNGINCLVFMEVDFGQEKIQTISKTSEYYNWLINPETYDYTSFNTEWLLQACPSYIRAKLYLAKDLRKIVEKELKDEYNSDLANFFIKYLC